MHFTRHGASGIAILVLFSATSLGQSRARPVVVALHGKESVLIRVAVGTVMPCNSESNHLVYEGPIDPGKTKEFWIASDCVCVQQTVAPFSGVDWGQARIFHAPVICNSFNNLPGKGVICLPAPDPTIRVFLQSTRR